MKTDEFYKKFLAELEIEDKDAPGASRIVAHLQSDKNIMGLASPPPGYEEHLLKALSRKLPEVKTSRVVSSQKVISFNWSSFFKGWGMSFAMALGGLLAFVVYNKGHLFNNSNKDESVAKSYIELVGADADSAEAWLATISDAGFRMENSGHDIQGMAHQISKDEKLLKRLNASLSNWER